MSTQYNFLLCSKRPYFVALLDTNDDGMIPPSGSLPPSARERPRRSELSADLAPAGLAFLAVLGVLLLPLLCVASCCAAAERHSLRRDAGSERWSRSRAEPTRLLAPAADSTARQEAPILSRVHEELNGVVPARFGMGSRLLRADRTSLPMRVKQYALVGSM